MSACYKKPCDIHGIIKMDECTKLELHYYFNDSSHHINAITRNKCEAEVLAIVSEIASQLDIETNLIAEVPTEGGFRDIWKVLGDNSNQLQVILMAAGLLTTFYFTYDPESNERTKELKQLQIEELKLKIKKLKNDENNQKLAKNVANSLSKNLKIIKRKSNFYTHLNNDLKIQKIGFNTLNHDNFPLSEVK